MADDDIKKVTDRITSVTTDIEKSLQDGGKDIERGMKNVNKRFGGAIERLKHTNQALSKISLDSINTQKSTYSGALQGNKLLGLQTSLANVMEGSVEKSSEEFKRLEEQFPDVDLTRYVKSHEKFMKAAEEQETLAFREQMLNGKKKALQERQNQEQEMLLGQTDEYQSLLKETEAARRNAEKLSKAYADKGTEEAREALEAENKRREELERKSEEVKKRTMESLDKRFEQEKSKLDKQGEDLDKLKAENTKVLDKQKAVKEKEEEAIGERMKEISEDAGRLGQFSDGLKTLTGFDLVGLADDVVKNIDAVGKVFGTDDLFQSMVMSVSSFTSGFTENFSSTIMNMKDSVVSGFAALPSIMSDGLSSLKEGVSSTITNIGQSMSDTFTSVKDGVMALPGKIKGGLKFMVGGVKAMGGALLQAGKAVMASAVRMIAAVAPFIMAGLAFVGGLLLTAGSMLMTALPFIAIGVAILAAGYLLYNAFMSMYENVGWFRGIIDTGISYIMNIGQAIFDIFSGMFDMVVGLFTGDFDRVMEGLKGMFGGIWDLLMAPFRAIGDFFKNVFDIDIGKILKNFAKKILPNWLVNKIFGDDAEEELTDEQAKTADGGGDMSPAAEAMATGLEDTDTQELINERKAQESISFDAEAQLNRRETQRRNAMRGRIIVNNEELKGEEKAALVNERVDSGYYDQMDMGRVETGFEGKTTEEIRNAKMQSDQAAMEIQGQLNERQDYVPSKLVETGEEDFLGDAEVVEVGDRVKTAREMEEESKQKEEAKPVMSAVTQQNNNQVNNSTTNISNRPVVNDSDQSSKLGYAVTF